MEKWGRDTQWRQGLLLPQSSFESIGLDVADSKNLTCGVVISHDCDLSQSSESEPDIEVIFGCHVDSPSGNFSYAKNPRRLHLQYKIDDEQITVELYASKKALISKSKLSSTPPSETTKIDCDNKSILHSQGG